MRAGAIAIAAAAAAAALAGAVAPPVALAHGERDPAIRTVIDRVEPAVPGLSVRVAPGVAQRLVVENGSSSTVEILAASGEPFLRVGPRGVEANTASPTWYASGNPDGIYRAPRPVGARLAPRWRPVSDEPRWAWFAHELHPRAGAVAPADIVAAGRRARLEDWRIRTRLDGRAGEIAGHLEYRPVLGSFTARLVSPAGGQAAPGVTVAVLAARAPGIFLSNDGNAPVVVEGPDGRPFARVGRAGTTVDVASPLYAEQPGRPRGSPRRRARRGPCGGGCRGRAGSAGWSRGRATGPTSRRARWSGGGPWYAGGRWGCGSAGGGCRCGRRRCGSRWRGRGALLVPPPTALPRRGRGWSWPLWSLVGRRWCFDGAPRAEAGGPVAAMRGRGVNFVNCALRERGWERAFRT